MSASDSSYPKPAMIVLNSWAGLFDQRCEVVGETAHRYRVRAATDLRLAGRNRHLRAGATALVPKHAVVLL